MDDLEDFKEPGSMAASELMAQLYTIMIQEGINQTDLAKRLGVSKMAVSKLFKNSQSVTLHRAERFARALGKDLHIYLTDRLDGGAGL